MRLFGLVVSMAEESGKFITRIQASVQPRLIEKRRTIRKNGLSGSFEKVRLH